MDLLKVCHPQLDQQQTKQLSEIFTSIEKSESKIFSIFLQ